MKYLPLLLLLIGCTPLTEQQRSERAIYWLEHEPDRVEKWGIYKYWCKESGIMLWGPYAKRCRRNKDCVPRRMDWDFLYKCRQDDINAQSSCEDELVARNRANWRAKGGNAVQCTSRRLF